MSPEQRAQIVFCRSDIPVTDKNAVIYALDEDEFLELQGGNFTPPDFEFPGHWYVLTVNGGLVEADTLIYGKEADSDSNS